MPTICLGKKKPRQRTLNKQLYQDIYQDPRWKRLRAAKFGVNPLCEKCEEKGKVTLTQEVHHKIPFQTGKTQEEIEALAFDWDNLQSLCVPCHKEADRKLRGGFHNTFIFCNFLSFFLINFQFIPLFFNIL